MRRTFATIEAAKLWRQDAQVDLRRGAIEAAKPLTVSQAAERWVKGARAGTVRNRSGEIYKPSALRGYEQALRDYILPALGGCRLNELRRGDVQRLADRLVEKGHGASTVRNAFLPLRAICRRAPTRGDININPTIGIELPAVRGKRDRIAGPTEAAQLISALPAADRPIWATALYAGLRLGELQALRWSDVDLARGVIHVTRSWDRGAGLVEPKSRAGIRIVPIASVLREQLVPFARQGDALAFGRSDDVPFSAGGVVDRAHRLWRAAGLAVITPHECRHTFASLMIAAEVNIKALQVFMGHASITVTMDRYGHLLPGSETEAAALLDAYLLGVGRT
ncbi:MAG: tyrosine-type recombinase/integrase [Solirubrobacteraceae bacterium]